NEALESARRIITPHSEIAALYANKHRLLDWSIPKETKTFRSKRSASQPLTIAFPSSTIGRKGSYELRAAVQGLDVKVVTLGPQLEGAEFWRETVIENRIAGEDWLKGIDVVVLPAFVEHKPGRLLEAVARGIPVIASTACGLLHINEIINIPVGDVEALRTEIKTLLTNGSFAENRYLRRGRDCSADGQTARASI
ncbi:MAG TPA: glycosyltransferase family 4 protein, partial [Pyrinomonadaceae bacterium]|nr:glycosyltransferase family 4 protein [Pyrinomonadaceae bacterium]